MSTITRLETATIATMDPLCGGSGYIEGSYHGSLWRCDGCGLVWTRRRQAEGCERRDHVAHFDEGPYGVRAMVNGRPIGNLRWYTRRAVRRDTVERVAPLSPLLVP